MSTKFTDDEGDFDAEIESSFTDENSEGSKEDAEDAEGEEESKSYLEENESSVGGECSSAKKVRFKVSVVSGFLV